MPDSTSLDGTFLQNDDGFTQSGDEWDVIQVNSRSFSMATRLLPKEMRTDVAKLYAWCRWCDNAVDDAPSQAVACHRLQMLMQDVKAIYSDQPIQLPASDWLRELVERYNIPPDLPRDLLRGMESDLKFKPMANDEALLLYCYRVAGVVGLMMCRVLGVTGQQALEHAKNLGIAMQLTNIARDIKEDWDRGRCYIPQTWIEAEDWPNDKVVRRSVNRLLKLAENYYDDGKLGYPALPANSRLGIRIAASLYREIGTEIENHQFDVLNQRHYISTSRKLKIVCVELTTDVRQRFLEVTRAGLARFKRPPQEQALPWTGGSNLGEPLMKSEFHYLAIFGLSMTLIMATVLFALMGMNPKRESYDLLPWIYSGCSAVGAAALWFWAQCIGRQLDTSQNS